MQSKKVDVKEAASKAFWCQNGYQYIWKQEISDVSLQSVDNAEDIDLDSLLEARIFTENEELHIFMYEDEWRAVITSAEAQDAFVEETQLLRERFGKNITIRHYMDYEEDGQAYIARSVLSRCE